MTPLSQLGDVPQRIGRYALTQRLAVGGMAELFLARVKGLEGFEKVVVLKRILPHLAADQDFVQMFLKEARLAATLDHPNIAHVHDIGREDGEYFFTMEYLHGEDLRKVLATLRDAGQRLPLTHALTIVREVAAGLHFAHEQVGFDGAPLGIVHRDVSPSNVIVTYAGGVKVVDFGIAKAAGPTHASRLSSLKGKAAYMSPEQCKARTLDRRSDVFAIGLLLFELVTGAPAFVAGNDLAVLHRVARGDVPDPRMVWPQCPEGLRALIVRAVALEPADRHPTALALQLELEAFAHQAHVPLSNALLGQFMLDVLGERPLPWLDAGPRPKLQLAPPRERTPATRAKAMPVVGEPDAIDSTVVVAGHIEQTVVGAATSSAGDPLADLGTLRVGAALPPAAAAEPLAEAPPRRPRWWIAAAVAGAGVVAIGSWFSLAARHEPAPEDAPREAIESPVAEVDEAIETEVPEPEAPTIAAAVEPPVVEDPPEDIDVQPPGEVVDADVAEPEAEVERDEAVEPARPRPRRTDGRDAKKSKRKPTPPSRPGDAGRKHSRPDLPGNDDPDAMLPY